MILVCESVLLKASAAPNLTELESNNLSILVVTMFLIQRL